MGSSAAACAASTRKRDQTASVPDLRDVAVAVGISASIEHGARQIIVELPAPRHVVRLQYHCH